MIGVEMIGRTGNQLFQYAFALAASKKLGTAFYISTASGYAFRLPNYFDLNGYSKLKNMVWRIITRFVKPRPQLIEDWTSPEDNAHLIEDGVLYSGFYQSERYFQSCQADVRKAFTLKAEHRNNFEKKYGDLFRTKKILAVHVRLTDYLNFGSEELGGKNLTLPLSYYEACLSQVNDSQYDCVFILSDDAAAAKALFGEKEQYRFSQESEIIDFQLMLNADALIIANSSFSWWAAYLNTRAEKVFAPKYWLGFKVKREYPVGACCQQWTAVEINLPSHLPAGLVASASTV